MFVSLSKLVACVVPIESPLEWTFCKWLLIVLEDNRIAERTQS